MEDLKDKLINELIEKGWNIEYIGGGYGQNLISDILESETIKSLLPVVGIELPKNLREVVEIKNRLLKENLDPYLGVSKEDAFEIGIETVLIDYMLKSDGN